jgi:hypothetical protein
MSINKYTTLYPYIKEYFSHLNWINRLCNQLKPKEDGLQIKTAFNFLVRYISNWSFFAQHLTPFPFIFENMAYNQFEGDPARKALLQRYCLNVPSKELIIRGRSPNLSRGFNKDVKSPKAFKKDINSPGEFTEEVKPPREFTKEVNSPKAFNKDVNSPGKFTKYDSTIQSFSFKTQTNKTQSKAPAKEKSEKACFPSFSNAEIWESSPLFSTPILSSTEFISKDVLDKFFQFDSIHSKFKNLDINNQLVTHFFEHESGSDTISNNLSSTLFPQINQNGNTGYMYNIPSPASPKDQPKSGSTPKNYKKQQPVPNLIESKKGHKDISPNFHIMNHLPQFIFQDFHLMSHFLPFINPLINPSAELFTTNVSSSKETISNELFTLIENKRTQKIRPRNHFLQFINPHVNPLAEPLITNVPTTMKAILGGLVTLTGNKMSRNQEKKGHRSLDHSIERFLKIDQKVRHDSLLPLKHFIVHDWLDTADNNFNGHNLVIAPKACLEYYLTDILNQLINLVTKSVSTINPNLRLSSSRNFYEDVHTKSLLAKGFSINIDRLSPSIIAEKIYEKRSPIIQPENSDGFKARKANQVINNTFNVTVNTSLSETGDTMIDLGGKLAEILRDEARRYGVKV